MTSGPTNDQAPSSSAAWNPEEAARFLDSVGQSHLLKTLIGLAPERAAELFAKITAIDWHGLRVTSAFGAGAAAQSGAVEYQQPDVLPLERREALREHYRAVGRAAYERGEVGVVMVAGGQGTRLGFEHPKGMFSVWPLSGRSLYQIFAERTLEASRIAGREIPLTIIVSPATAPESREFFRANKNFGLAEGQLRFFSQGTVATTDSEGRALLASPDTLLENPDGHGGCVRSLVQSGEVKRMIAAGARYLVYIQVDNPSAQVYDDFLVGQMIEEKLEMVTKVVKKAGPMERVGNLVSTGSADIMVEYSDLPEEQARQTTPGGELLFRWANTAMHVFSTEFLERSLGTGHLLQYHQARKKVQAFVDGQMIETVGIKSELFVFDLVPAARHRGIEVLRADEFAPVKNETGVDSPATARKITTEMFARWLRKAGVEVELDSGAMIEISPLFAGSEEQFLQRWDGRVSRISADFVIE